MQTVIAKIVDEDELIKTAVDEFLRWKLPEDFNPDGGIVFNKPEGLPDYYWPTGTNLLSSAQAEQMVRHILGIGAPNGLITGAPPSVKKNDAK